MANAVDGNITQRFQNPFELSNRALSLLRHRSPAAAAASAFALNPNSNSKQDDEAIKRNGSLPQVQLQESKEGNCREEEERNVENEEMMDQGKLDGGDCLEKLVDDAEVAAEKTVDIVYGDGDGKLQSLDVMLEKAAEPAEPATNPNTSDKAAVLDGKEKSKKEVEEKLETLNAKRHNVVQALKQILNAEEELKRRNCTQGIVTRPSGSLQVDVTSDSGLMARQNIPRTG